MPYVSKAQQGYMHAAAERGEIPKSVVKEFDKASKGHTDLPEHAGKHTHSKHGSHSDGSKSESHAKNDHKPSKE
jgi:hypothetical protein